jgi:transposase
MGRITAKNALRVNWKTLIVSVDIGKTFNTGYLRLVGGGEVKPFEFFNNGRGFRKFWSEICKAIQAFSPNDVVVGFESTGAYGEPLVHYLRSKKGIRLVQVNPMHTKRVKELQGNSPNKTDLKDPRVIADIIELGHGLTLVVPEGAAAELRRLTHARERSVQRRTALFNQLQELMFVVFPEFFQVMKDVKTKSARYLLKHFPTPEQILACGLGPLTDILRKVSRGKLGAERAKSLYEAVQDSVGIREGRESILLEIQEILSHVDSSDRFVSRLEEELCRHLQEIPASRYLLSMNGIGTITAAGLIGEVADFDKFHTISEVTKLAGLDLFEISSGKHRGMRRISKRGRPLMRKLLYFAALNTVRKGGVMHEKYRSYLDRGMIKTKALVAIARKLLGILFALVRDHCEYTKDYSNTANMKAAA